MARKRRFSKPIASGSDEPGVRYFKLVLFFSIGIIAIMIAASLIAFFMTIESEEQTLVPDVRGMDTANAMIELRQKGLFGEVHLRVSANPSDKGTVLVQEPNPGTLVKVGRTVELRVSKGPIIDEVDHYVNMKLSDLKLQLQSMSTIYGALLTIKEPVIEVYDDAPEGTILEQKPEPGTKITGPTELELVISRGPRGALVTVPDYTGLGFYEALSRSADNDSPFVFSSAPAEEDQEPGTVVSQSPAAGSAVEQGTLMNFIVTEPEDIEEGWAFGIVRRTLPDYPSPINIMIEVVRPDEETRRLASMRYPGGPIAIPYLEPENTQIVVSTPVRGLFTHTVRAPATE